MIEVVTKKYAFSKDSEYFSGECETREQAIEEAKANYPEVEHFYIGEMVGIQLSKDDSYADMIIDAIQENAYDNYGEFAEDYLDDVTKEDRAELDELLGEVVVKWANDHGHQPSFFLVPESERVDAYD